MDHRDVAGAAPFAERIDLWRTDPGGIDSHGSLITEPAELTRARLILGLCDRFRCLPGQVLAEDAGLLRMLDVHRLGTPEPDPDGGDPW